MRALAVRTELARAKINLTLHIGAKAQDGYHPVSSLCAFADIGDRLGWAAAKFSTDSHLSVSGPFARGVPQGGENLILKAARFAGTGPAHFHLVKNLPPASGIGGGSADAAAALRLLGLPSLPDSEMSQKLSRELGADLPLCLYSRTCTVCGIGEQITPIPGLGRHAAVLVNPGIELSTGKVFAVFDGMPHKKADALPATDIKAPDLLAAARAGHNDLQAAAISIVPQIADVLATLQSAKGCQLARMSGSGATCFALFETQDLAAAAAEAISVQNRSWWAISTVLGDPL